ncbi:MAG: hypothetical protein LIP08_04950 [Bacteroides sp.]|nr:hypothetical protein [Bacteroides sp.]
MLYLCKRSWIWLSRIRHRCGYGVHSPFAFHFITRVIYEKDAYYAYREIPVWLKKQLQDTEITWQQEPERINRLLFRIANYACPDVIADIGPSTSAAYYMQAARRQARYVAGTDACDFSLSAEEAGLIYLHTADASDTEAAFRHCLPLTTSRTLMVVRDIHRDRAMRCLWKQMKEEDRVGVTFDLYDVGILFFDRSRIKQHYIVNF